METPQTSDEHGATEPVKIKVRPTLFVALGGTGKEIVLRLRRRILQADWNGKRVGRITDFPVAAFLYFDTDTAEALQSDRAPGNDPLWSEIRLAMGECLQKKIDVSEWLRERDKYPHVNEWLPGIEFKETEAGQGAGQVRAVSRLLFFEQVQNFHDRAVQKINGLLANVTNEEKLRALGLSTERQARVVVIASAAGGTGSGCFLDAGYLLRSLPTTEEPAVDLFLVLGTGFSQMTNPRRVSANTFATMMELEHCMRARSEPRFVEAWSEELQPRSDILPYDDVFLMDTTNVAGEKTAYIDDIYNMVADILFEDFGSGEFAMRKRSVAVNQRQHKILPYFAATTTDVGTQTLQYARTFSSVGQTTIDTQSQVAFDTAVAEAGRQMMRRYFGVSELEKRHVPTADERNNFAANYLHLGRTSFDDYPEHIRHQVQAISEYQLVNELLKREDGSSIEAAVRTAIENDFVTLASRVQDHKDWPAELVKLRDLHRRDIDDSVDTGGRPARLRTVEEAAQRLREAWVDHRRLASALYERLDNHELGGLDYTIELIDQLKTYIDDENQGAISRFEKAASAYGGAASLAMKQFELSLTNLGQTASGGLFGRRRMAERIVTLAKTDLIHHCVYRLRARACVEAIKLLREVSTYLGEASATADDEGETTRTGLAGEFITGRRNVLATLDELDVELRYFAEIRARKEATYLVAQEQRAADVHVPEDINRWSEEAFDGYGGSAQLFWLLRSPEGKVGLINKLRAIAKQKLEPQLRNIPSARNVLQHMLPTDRRALLQNAINRCMPWVEADLTRMKPEFKNDQYTLLISVSGVEDFRSKFEAEIKSVLPSQVGDITLNVIESSVVGRIVFYCELSGITLDTLNPLRTTWYRFYKAETKDKAKTSPLHTYRDAEATVRFPIPVVPAVKELRDRQDEMALFLCAIAYGLLTRTTPSGRSRVAAQGAGETDGVYKIEWEKGDRHPIGTEREIRWNGFYPDQRSMLTEQVKRFEEALTPVQVLAATALLRFTHERVYASRFVTLRGTAQTRRPGFTSMAAKKAAERLLQVYFSIAETDDPDEKQAEAIIQEMIKGIETWTKAIPGSLKDIDDSEANMDDPSRERRAQEKRTVIPEKFADAALRRSFVDVTRPTPEQRTDVSDTSYIGVASLPPAPASPGNTRGSTMMEIQQELDILKRLRDERDISEERFEELKEKLLSRIG